MEKIRSTANEIKPIEILGDKVYTRKNIMHIQENDSENEKGFTGWEYDESIVSVDEFLSIVSAMGQQITNLMMEV